MTFIQKLNTSIPTESESVKHYFTQASSDGVDHHLFFRYIDASRAIFCSAVNIPLYLLTPAGRLVVAIGTLNFNNFINSCSKDLSNAGNSLYFTAGMTLFLFLTAFSSNYSLRPKPISHDSSSTHTTDDESSSEQEELREVITSGTGASTPPPKPTEQPTIVSAPDNKENPSETDGWVEAVDPNDASTEEGWLSGSMLLSQRSSNTPSLAQSSTENLLESSWVAVEKTPAELQAYKYRSFFLHMRILLKKQDWITSYENVLRQNNSPLKHQCQELYTLIQTEPTNAEQHYYNFVVALRKGCELFKNNTQGPCITWVAHPCITWVAHLCYVRFAGLRLYRYCEELVTSVSGPFKSLSLENFWEELQARNAVIKKKMETESYYSSFKRVSTKARGFANIGFDPLSGSNIPYIYGQFCELNRVVTILRHGVPVEQTEGIAFAFRAFQGWAGNSIPPINPDYQVFIDTALAKKQNILHLIFEDGDLKVVGDESARVQARLELAKERTNFFPIALRLDGKFFHPKNYQSEPIRIVKSTFSENLFGKLEITGFGMSVRTRQKFTPKHFSEIMEEVHELYFKDHLILKSLGEYQAFILFTYAHMTLSLLDILDISILEAHCKDDIDRGGAFKAILILHYLYLTGKLKDSTAESLQNIMVNIIAAPFIVKEQPIIDSRAMFIKHALEVLQRVVETKPIPDQVRQGEFKVLG